MTYFRWSISGIPDGILLCFRCFVHDHWLIPVSSGEISARLRHFASDIALRPGGVPAIESSAKIIPISALISVKFIV